MEIRCSNCEHVGAAASVVPTDAGVVLVCENCGHGNLLDVPAGTDAPSAAPKPAPRLAEKSVDTSSEIGWLTKGALERLIPEVGDGQRCAKCAQLIPQDDDHCPRCGLSVVEGHRYGPGQAPWERAPDGREGAFEQATLLWKSVVENPTDDNITKFASFVREESLLEYGIRKLRFFLVDHPGHEHAIAHLEEMAESFQAKMIVARAKAELRSDNIVVATTRIRTAMLGVVFVIFSSIFLLFLTQVAGPAC